MGSCSVTLLIRYRVLGRKAATTTLDAVHRKLLIFFFFKVCLLRSPQGYQARSGNNSRLGRAPRIESMYVTLSER